MTNNKTQKKINTLKNIENICLSTSLISAGGFLTGALIDNEQLALISGVTAVVSILGKYHSKNRIKYLEEDTTEQNITPQEYPNLKSSDYAKNLEHYTKVVKKIFNKDQYKPINKK